MSAENNAKWMVNHVPEPHLFYHARLLAPDRSFTTGDDVAEFLSKSKDQRFFATLKKEYFYPSCFPVRWYKAEANGPITAAEILSAAERTLGKVDRESRPTIKRGSMVPFDIRQEHGLVKLEFVGRTHCVSFEENFQSVLVYPDQHFVLYIHPDSLTIEVFTHGCFKTIMNHLKEKVFPKGPITSFAQYITKRNDVLSLIKKSLKARKFKAWTESMDKEYDKEGKEIDLSRDLDSIPNYSRIYSTARLYRAALSFDVKHDDGYVEKDVFFRYNSSKDDISFSPNISKTAISRFRNAVVSLAGTRHV
jgi:hypothetical protein